MRSNESVEEKYDGVRMKLIDLYRLAKTGPINPGDVVFEELMEQWDKRQIMGI